jgi:serine/threonine-protein kinase
LAQKCFGEQHYLSLARGAAWTAFEAAASGGDLCCGAAGRAYALLSFYRQDGDPLWLERARGLGDRAAEMISKRHLRKDSLYRGEAGVCLLIDELAAPDRARMPLFELH